MENTQYFVCLKLTVMVKLNCKIDYIFIGYTSHVQC